MVVSARVYFGVQDFLINLCYCVFKILPHSFAKLHRLSSARISDKKNACTLGEYDLLYLTVDQDLQCGS